MAGPHWWLTDRTRASRSSSGDLGSRVEGHHLTPCVHAGVGPAGHGRVDVLAQVTPQRTGELTGHGADPVVGRGRGTGPVVGEDHAHVGHPPGSPSPMGCHKPGLPVVERADEEVPHARGTLRHRRDRRRPGRAGRRCGAAETGRHVVLLDAHQPGGRAQVDDRNGYRFNRGPRALYVGGAGHEVLRHFGVRTDRGGARRR